MLEKNSPRNMQFNSETNTHNTQWYCLISSVPQTLFEGMSDYGH